MTVEPTRPPVEAGRARWRRAAVPALAMVTAGTLAVSFLRQGSALRPAPARGGFYHRRGPADAEPSSPQLLVFRLSGGLPVVPAPITISRRDELAFAYTNPTGRRHLMVFGVDEARRVFWYHPEWAVGAAPPAAIRARPGAGPHEITEAVQHNLGRGTLRVFGVFLDAPLSVTAVEAAVALSADGLPELPGATIVEVPLEVRE